jgi:hypothetical protein
VSAGWASSMQAALVAAMAHPAWWAMSLAAFLIRGGVVLVALPLFSLPTSASLTTMLAPPLEALILGRPSVAGVAMAVALIVLVVGLLSVIGVAGAWLDDALAREAVDDEELELDWVPQRHSALAALGVRLAAHVPTLLAAGFAVVRLSIATRDELLDPGDPAVALVARVLLRAPDALAVVALAWLVGEAVGPLAARRLGTGERAGPALRRATGQVLGRRGLATLVVTTSILLAIAVPFVLSVGRAWENVSASLALRLDVVTTGAALLLLASTWVLGLALLGAALAFRATAWTLLAAASPAGASPQPLPAHEASAG